MAVGLWRHRRRRLLRVHAYAAYCAAAAWYQALGEPEVATAWRGRAASLRLRFQDAFWLPDLETYAMALDGAKRPLRVRNSDAGQLLWSGIVPESHADQLVRSLFGPATWSGWGLRTLGAGERRYNPASYHNGSVWPHDTALFAGGLERYGFTAEARIVRDALYALAAALVYLLGFEAEHARPAAFGAAMPAEAYPAAAVDLHST